MGLAGTLDLGHVSAVELQVTSVGQRVGDVPREGDRDESVAPTPDEQRVGLQLAQPRPEAALAVGFLQVDVTRGGVERGPTGRRQVRTQELVDAGCGPAFVRTRDEAVHDRLDDRPRGDLDQSELRPREPEQRRPRTLPSPRQRRTEQHEAVDPVGIQEPDLQRDAPAKAVADQMNPLELERVEQCDDSAGEEASVVARADRLVGVAEPGEVERDHAIAGAQRGHGGQERSLGAAQPVYGHQRRAAPGLQRRDSSATSGDHPELQASGTGQSARRRQEPDAEVQVAPHRQAAGAVSVHSAADVVGDGAPHLRIGGERRVGIALGGHEPRLLAIDDSVPGVAPENRETDARAAALRLERSAVVATGQRLERARRRSHEEASVVRQRSYRMSPYSSMKRINRVPDRADALTGAARSGSSLPLRGLYWGHLRVIADGARAGTAYAHGHARPARADRGGRSRVSGRRGCARARAARA